MAKVRRDFRYTLKLTEREFKDLFEVLSPNRTFEITDYQKETLNEIYEAMVKAGGLH